MTSGAVDSSERPSGPPAIEAGRRPEVLAFLDIGTNSIRMVIVRFTADGSYAVLNQEKETVRLGEGEFAGGDLQQGAMDRAVLVCRRFREMAEAYGVADIVAVATSATREARNRRDFVSRLSVEAGIEVRTVSGREEARLIYLGVANAVHLVGRTAVFIDVGGGSTEVIVGGQSAYHELDSLKLGAIRLANEYLVPDDPAPVPARVYERMVRHARDASVRMVARLAAWPVDLAIGGSGTIENLADIAIRSAFGRPRGRDDALTREQVRQTAGALRKMTLAERRKVPGMSVGRADIIVPGAAIVEALMDAFGLSELQISDRGLREGLIVDHLARNNPKLLEAYNVRERSVVQLGRACHFDEQHANVVRRLAMQLFDSGARVGLHGMSPVEREALEHAAMLHDIGTFLSHSRHERHAYYLIRHADLLGFDESEIAFVAALARFHRKGYPKGSRPEMVDLGPESRRGLPALGVLLRLAESLDRSHAGLVREASFSLPSRREAVLQLHATGEPSLELWGARQHARAFRRAFDRALTVALLPEA